MIADRSDQKNNDLYVVEAIVTDTCQVVRSSISDWADVIGDELIAIEKIRRLEQEKVELNEESSTAPARAESETLKEINRQIAELRATLPARLQLASRSDDGMSRGARHAARWVAEQHKETAGFRLIVVTGDGYPHSRDHLTLTQDEKLHTIKDESGRFDVVDSSGAILGRLMNESPLSYDDFMGALENCYGASSILLEFVEQRGSEIRKGQLYAWFSVKVVQQPEIDKRTKLSSGKPLGHLPKTSSRDVPRRDEK